MSNKNRGDRIQLLHKVVKKYYKPVAIPEGRTVLEHLIYGCCLEDARYESADEAFHRLQESYFDWNEVRVTTVTELAEVLHNLPDPSAAAVRVKKNLQSKSKSANRLPKSSTPTRTLRLRCIASSANTSAVN